MSEDLTFLKLLTTRVISRPFHEPIEVAGAVIVSVKTGRREQLVDSTIRYRVSYESYVKENTSRRTWRHRRRRTAILSTPRLTPMV